MVYTLVLTCLLWVAYSFVAPMGILKAPAVRQTKLFASSTPPTYVSLRDSPTKYTFVGGKGGVGKTTTSSAIAVGYSDAGKRTLIVSTDPAHSLGDALDIELQPGVVTPIVTEQNLWALEVDIDSAIDEFRKTAEGLDVDRCTRVVRTHTHTHTITPLSLPSISLILTLPVFDIHDDGLSRMYSLARDIGISREMIEGLGLEDVTSLFQNPPPGIDEIVALLEIFKLGGLQGGAQAYDKIVIDTAPTGHTLRLLELPQFLDKVTGSLLRLRAKLTGAIQGFKNMFGGGNPSQPQKEPLLDVLEKLERYQLRLTDMRAALKDASQTQFVIVTIPTSLAVAESTRLVTSLQAQGIAVNKVVCNQLIQEGADAAYLSTRVRAQRECITSLTAAAPPTVEITEVPFLDTEVVGPYGLKFFASMAHPVDASVASNPMGSKKLTIFGGKGGVGKTTVAAAWGVALADAGLRTLVVSTDPAHSLGDAFMTPLGDKPQQIELPGASSPGPGSSSSRSQSQSQLWAMEIDPDAALAEFRDTVEDTMRSAGGGGAMASMGLPDLKAEVMNLLMDTDNPPPGTDEIVAMTRVISYLDDGLTMPSGEVLTFDRVVLDTAPTGHTLRMLALPTFLQVLVDKVKAIRDSSTGGILGSILGGGGGARGGAAAAGSGDGGPLGEDRLMRFQERMGRLEDVLHNPSESEFSIVTIPTQLATAETKRLMQALAADSVAVRRIIINQVLPVDQAETPEASDAFLTRTRSAQQASVAQLRRLVGLTPGMELVEVPHFDTELRTVFGLRLLGNVVLQ